jgi:hypothetical protein
MQEPTCANILKKSNEWNVVTTLITGMIESSSIPGKDKGQIRTAIKGTKNWSEIHDVLRGKGGTSTGTSASDQTISNVGKESFTKAQTICDQVKHGYFEGAVPTGYRVPDTSDCKIPGLRTPLEPLGSCFITFPDLRGYADVPDEATRQEIKRRIDTLQRELGFSYDLVHPVKF